MVAGNRTRPVTKAMYHPATVNPGFMGANPPTHCDNSPGNPGSKSYFRNYRNETLSRFLMPPYDWGAQTFPYSPKPNLLSANQARSYDRALAIPIHDVTTIDSERMKEIDDMYKSVQLQREQYKDRTGLLHPLKYFRPDEYDFPSPPSLLPAYLSKYPATYTAYKVPPVLPLTYERTMKIPYLPELAISGIHARGGCIAYKT